MEYEVVQVIVRYANNKREIEFIAVMWVSAPGWVRATYADRKVIGGYCYLRPTMTLCDALIQEVCATGMNCPDKVKKLFYNPDNLKFEK